MNQTIEAFVRAATEPMRAPLVPEIELRLAMDPHGIFQATETFGRAGLRLPPYWAFAWPGGQAAARLLLDDPALVRGRRVLDIGAGSGIAAIAAAKAGAAAVLAADIDPLAATAIALNAIANAAVVDVTTRDVLGEAPDADVVLIGDLVYEPELGTRVASFLELAARGQARVLLADRTTAARPPLPFDLVVEHAAPVMPELIEAHFERARVWQLRAPPSKATAPRGRRTT